MLQTITTNSCEQDYKSIKYYSDLEEIKAEWVEDIVFNHDYEGNRIYFDDYEPYEGEIERDLYLLNLIKSPTTIEEMNKVFEKLSDSYYLTKVFEVD